MTYLVRVDPPERVGNSVDNITDHIVSSSQIFPVLSDEHPNEPEVTPELALFIDDMPSMPGTMPTDEISFDDVLSDLLNVEIYNKYELPQRITQGSIEELRSKI